jgi:tRNA(adenine34) deaminase
VVVCQNKIIGRAHNQTEQLTDATAHAEMLAITAAANFLGSKYLDECTLYVTLEPCVMCAGALHWVQLQQLIFGASDMQRGYSLVHQPLLHPRTVVKKGVGELESKELLNQFFKKTKRIALYKCLEDQASLAFLAFAFSESTFLPFLCSPNRITSLVISYCLAACIIA